MGKVTLTRRQEKTLRYVATCSHLPVKPSMCVVRVGSSDLPSNPAMARMTLEVLHAQRLVTRCERGYWPTQDGKRWIKGITQR